MYHDMKKKPFFRHFLLTAALAGCISAGSLISVLSALSREGFSIFVFPSPDIRCRRKYSRRSFHGRYLCFC